MMNQLSRENGRGNRLFVGVDIGGTNTKAGLVEDTRILSCISVPTAAAEGPQETLERVARLVEEITHGVDGIESIGVGIPGLIKEGVLVGAANFPGWENVPVQGLLSSRLGRTVEVFLDLEAVALGEFMAGGYLPPKDLCVFTLGTGVGVAFVLRGRVFSGAGGFMAVALPQGESRLHSTRLENLISGPAIVSRARAALALHPKSVLHDVEDLSIEQIADAARAGDTAAIQIWQETGRYLGLAAVNMAHLLLLDRIVVGGGVSHAWDLFSDSTREIFRKLAAPPVAECELVVSRLQENAGILGAALGAAGKSAKE